MKLHYLAAIAAVVIFPLSSHAQKSGAAKATDADAQKVVKIISADKAKLKMYCDLSALSDQADEAEKKKDTKKAEAVATQMDEISGKLGPEYAALMDGIDQLAANFQRGPNDQRDTRQARRHVREIAAGESRGSRPVNHS